MYHCYYFLDLYIFFVFSTAITFYTDVIYAFATQSLSLAREDGVCCVGYSDGVGQIGAVSLSQAREDGVCGEKGIFFTPARFEQNYLTQECA